MTFPGALRIRELSQHPINIAFPLPMISSGGSRRLDAADRHHGAVQPQLTWGNPPAFSGHQMCSAFSIVPSIIMVASTCSKKVRSIEIEGIRLLGGCGMIPPLKKLELISPHKKLLRAIGDTSSCMVRQDIP